LTEGKLLYSLDNFINLLNVLSSHFSNASNKQAAAVRRRLKKYYEKYSDIGYSFSSSLSEQTVLFLKKRPKDVLDVIKIAKHWNKQLPIKSYVSGRSFIIELVAVHSQKALPGCSLLQRFIRFLRCMEVQSSIIFTSSKICFLIQDFSTLQIVFGYHYKKTSVPENILRQKPLIMDPCNPYNNLAYKIDKGAIAMFEMYARITLDILRDSVNDVNEVFDF
jgi:hypothetical protein